MLTDIYAAGEPPIEGITGERLAEAISSAGHKNVIYSSTLQGGIEYILREARAGDAVLDHRRRQRGRVLEQLAVLLGSRVSTFTCGLTTTRVVAAERARRRGAPGRVAEARKLRSASAARRTSFCSAATNRSRT